MIVINHYYGIQMCTYRLAICFIRDLICVFNFKSNICLLIAFSLIKFCIQGYCPVYIDYAAQKICVSFRLNVIS